MSEPEKTTDDAKDAGGRRIVHETLIAAPIDAVWRALTTRDLIVEWLGANDLRPEAGRPFTLELANEAGEVSYADGRVLEVEPERRLRFSLTEFEDGPEPVEIRSTVRIDLTQTEDGVRFRLVHDGFERVPVAAPAHALVWAVAQQRVLQIRRSPRLRRPAAPIAVHCGPGRLAWAA